MRQICFQKEMRDAEAIADPRPQDASIAYTIGPIDADEATVFIKRYEWLGTVNAALARYCARNEAGEVAAVALFGRPHVNSAALCRPLDIRNMSDEDRAYLDTVVCLERGACAHWAHPHCASWFLPRVLAQANADHGWRIVYAYSDPEAGEIGTIYQACNWLYIGQGSGRTGRNGTERERWYFSHKDWPADRAWITSRSFYRRGLSDEQIGEKEGKAHGAGLSDDRPWIRKHTIPKHRYVQFVADRRDRKELLKALRYPVLPYPKRPQQKARQR